MSRYQQRVWKKFGEEDPYWAVLTRDEYHGELTGETKTKFFQTGETHLQSVLREIERFAPSFAPTRALDFGCGVGRVAIPMARRFSTAGVDVSPGMLKEARKNAGEQGVEIELGHQPQGEFDFIHSFIVFQHIPVAMGMPLIGDLLGRLKSGGIATIHVTYHLDASLPRKTARFLRYKLSPVNYLANLVQGKPWDAPRTEMHVYDMNDLLHLFYRHRVTRMFFDHPQQPEWEYKAAMMYLLKA